jgi:hypothetical protein
VKANRQQLAEATARLAALEQLFNDTPAPTATRPRATGTDDTLTQF